MRIRKTKSLFSTTSEGVRTCTKLVYQLNTDHCCIGTCFLKATVCSGTSKTNRSCPQFLGVHVAERVLSKIFNNVERMPLHNPGYDFVCNRGKKIDVKSATMHKNYWSFHIYRNKIADYFLCIAFDNRADLNPIHIWLLPSDVISDKVCVKISLSTISKWTEYEQFNKLYEVVACCNTINKEYKP